MTIRLSDAERDRGLAQDCERILRSLPLWFGIEESLLAYAQDTTRLPTFVSLEDDGLVGFLTLRSHFDVSYEIHCVAVHRDWRGRGLGRALVEQAKNWSRLQGGRYLQVKTIAATDPSWEYAQTRVFYERVGFLPLEVFPTLWDAHNPCLQLILAL